MIANVFNKCCKIAEKINDEKLKNALNKSNLFVIEKHSLRRANTDKITQYISDALPLMPFDTCAIELDNIVATDNKETPGAIVFEITDNIDKDALRNYTLNFWLAIYVTGVTISITSGQIIVYENIIRDFKNILNLMEKKLDQEFGDNIKYELSVGFNDNLIISDDDCEKVMYIELNDENVQDAKKYKQEATDTASIWFRLFTSIVNAEKSFILEETPLSYNPDKKEKKILRAHQRPQYTVLSPLAIRHKLSINQPKAEKGHHKSPVPHERRRHKRKLRVESGYKENRDIIIEATWVGESEKRIGNKIYKVRLDV